MIFCPREGHFFFRRFVYLAPVAVVTRGHILLVVCVSSIETKYFAAALICNVFYIKFINALKELAAF